MVPPTSMRISRARMYYGYLSSALCFTYETLTLSGRPSHALRLHSAVFLQVHYPEDIAASGLASSVFANHYLRNLV